MRAAAATTTAAAATITMVLLLSHRAAAIAAAISCSSRIGGIAIPRGGRAAAAIDGVANGRWRPSLRGRIGARDADQVVGIMREEPLHLAEVTQGVLDPSGQLIFLARFHLDGGPEDGMSSRLSSAHARAKRAGLPLPLSKGITLHAGCAAVPQGVKMVVSPGRRHVTGHGHRPVDQTRRRSKPSVGEKAEDRLRRK